MFIFDSYLHWLVSMAEFWMHVGNNWVCTVGTTSFLAYSKFPKYSDTQKICCNQPKIWTMWLYHRVMSPNDADGMTNCVDPDQTAPLGAVWSGSALFAQA